MASEIADIDFKLFEEKRLIPFQPRIIPSKKDPTIKYGRMDLRYNHSTTGPIVLGECIVAGPLMVDTRGLHVAKNQAPATASPFGTPGAQFGAPGQFAGAQGQFAGAQGQFAGAQGQMYGQFNGQFGAPPPSYGAGMQQGMPMMAPSAESKDNGNEVLDGRCKNKDDSDAMVRVMDGIKRVAAQQALDSGFFAQSLASVADKLGFVMAKFSNLYWVDMDGTKPVEGVFPSFRFKHTKNTRYVYPDNTPLTLEQMRKYAFDFVPRFHVQWVYMINGQIAVQKYLASATIMDVHEQSTVAPPTALNARITQADPEAAKKAREAMMRLMSSAKAREDSGDIKKEPETKREPEKPTGQPSPTSQLPTPSTQSAQSALASASTSSPTTVASTVIPTGLQGASISSMSSSSDMLEQLMRARASGAPIS